MTILKSRLEGGILSSPSWQQREESKKSIRFDKVVKTSSAADSAASSSATSVQEHSVANTAATSTCTTSASVHQPDSSVATPRIRNTSPAPSKHRAVSAVASFGAATGRRWGSSSNINNNNQICTALSTISSAASTEGEARDLLVADDSVVAAAAGVDGATTVAANNSANATGPPSLILGPPPRKQSATQKAQKALSVLAAAVRQAGTSMSSTGSLSVAGSFYLRKNDTSREKISILGLVAEQPASKMVTQTFSAVSQRILPNNNNNNNMQQPQTSDSAMPSSSATPRCRGRSLDRSSARGGGGGGEGEQQRHTATAEDEETPEQPQQDSSSSSSRRGGGLLQRMISSSNSSSSKDRRRSMVRLHSLEAVSQQRNGDAVRIRVSDVLTTRSSSLDPGRGRSGSRRLRSRSCNNTSTTSRGGSLVMARSRSLESNAAQAHAASLSPVRRSSSNLHTREAITTTRSNETSRRSKLVLRELQSLFSSSSRGSSDTDAKSSSERGHRLRAMMAARLQSLSALTTATTKTAAKTTTKSTNATNGSHRNKPARLSLSTVGRNGIRAITSLAGRKDSATTIPSSTKTVSKSEISEDCGAGGNQSGRGRDRSRSRSRTRGSSRSNSRGVESEELLTSGGELFLSSSIASDRNSSKKSAPTSKSPAASPRSHPSINRMTNSPCNTSNKDKRAKGGARLADSIYDPVVVAMATNIFSCSDCDAGNKDTVNTTMYDSKKPAKTMRDLLANKRAERATNNAIYDLIPIPWEHMADKANTTAAQRAVGGALPAVLSPPSCQRAFQPQDMPTTMARQLATRPNHQGEEKEEQQQVTDHIGSDLKAAADNVYQSVLSIAACYEYGRPEEGKVNPASSSYYYPREGSLLSRNGEEKCSRDDSMGRIRPCHTSSSLSSTGPLPSVQGGYSV